MFATLNAKAPARTSPPAATAAAAHLVGDIPPRASGCPTESAQLRQASLKLSSRPQFVQYMLVPFAGWLAKTGSSDARHMQQKIMRSQKRKAY